MINEMRDPSQASWMMDSQHATTVIPVLLGR